MKINIKIIRSIPVLLIVSITLAFSLSASSLMSCDKAPENAENIYVNSPVDASPTPSSSLTPSLDATPSDSSSLGTTSSSISPNPSNSSSKQMSDTIGTTVPIPPLSSSKKLLGFTLGPSYASMSAHANSLSEIAIATYVTDGYGNITGTVLINQISLANSKGIKPYLLIGNNFSGATAKTLLENENNRRNFINNLKNILGTNNYKGVNMDLEGVYSSDRSYYTLFMSEISSALKPLGYIVSICVPAKTSDSGNSWSAAFDYASIGKYVDFVVVMTYDEHCSGYGPGSVASINWVKSVVNYTISVIPAGKIYLGLAAYGYDWGNSSAAQAYSINGCYDIANNHNSQIIFDPVSKTPYFNYTDNSGIYHTVWFENSQSIAYKLDLINSYGLAGAAVWRLGLENSDYWNTITSKI